MQNHICVFNHADFGKLEIMKIDDKLYFPATECAMILGYANPQKAIRDHCNWVNESFTQSSKGPRKKKFIPEGDLYRLIVRSKLPAAELFEKWVFDEILPSIRKYGAFVTDNTLEQFIDNPEAATSFFSMVKQERKKKEALERQIAVIEPKARYYDIILLCTTAIPISVIAKDYGFSAIKFNRLLHSLGIQFKIRGTWLLYREHDSKGYTISQTYHVQGIEAAIHTYWTQKGRKFIYDSLRAHGMLPLVEREDA